jgi:polysaccharide biosynthesis/export protein
LGIVILSGWDLKRYTTGMLVRFRGILVRVPLLSLFVALITVGVFSTSGFCQTNQAPNYVLGPDDQISVTVVKHPEFSGVFTVPEGGEIDVPVVGRTRASGKTIFELSEQIRVALSARLRKPEISIALLHTRVRRIYLLGDVKVPGTYDFKPGWRLSQAISSAGSVISGNDPKDVTVTLTHFDGTRLSVSFDEILHGQLKSDLPVQPDDKIAVEILPTIPVSIFGHVLKPGLYRLRADSTSILQAIAAASGFDPLASTAHIRIQPLKGDPTEVDLTPLVLRGENVDTPLLHAGDTVIVPEAQNRVVVLGLVKVPGIFPIPDGKKFTLLEALALAQGHDTKRARMSRVAILRIVDGKQLRMVFDLTKTLSKGDARQNPQILSNDVIFVPETNSIDWTLLSSSVSALGILSNAIK